MTNHGQLDQTDYKILDLLQSDALQQVGDIARKVHKSPSTTSYRIGKLQTKGVIKKYVAVLDRSLVGRPLLVIILVKLRLHHQQTKLDFAATMNQLPEVEYAAQLNGEHDFLLHVNLRSVEQYEQFLNEKLCTLECVEKVQSSLVVKEVKTLTALPLSD